MPAAHRNFRLAVLCLAVALTVFGSPPLRAAPPSDLLGTWKFDPARSTDLSPWRDCRLTLSQSGHLLTISRSLNWGRRNHEESMTLDLNATTTTIPAPWWVDNRHLGAYTNPDSTKTVSARWLDDGRLLRLETDIVLETQQGPRAVNILSHYQVSPDGQVLTVTDLRSTRPSPVIHVFNRVSE